MQTKIIERYFFFGLLLATFIFTFMIFQPFWIVLVLGASFSVVLHPLYNWFIKKHFSRGISSFVTVAIFTIVLLGPILTIGVIVFNQSQNLYQGVASGEAIGPFVDKINETINGVLPKGVDINLEQKVSDFIVYISNNIAGIFTTTLSAFASFFLMILSIYFFLKDGTRWKEALIKLSPLSQTDDEKIINRIKTAINGVVRGYLLIAIAQGVLASIGLWIFGVPNPALWGVIAGICSLIPMVGTSFVSIPAIAFLLLGGNTGAAIGLLIWSAGLVGTIDNFLSPYLVSGKIKLPPLLILFSVLGGIALLGPIGVLMGPLTISMLYALISIYTNEFKEERSG